MVNISDNIQEWDLGEITRIWNTYTTPADIAVNPGSITLKIYDPTGTLDKTVTYPGDIVRSETGVFYYDYEIAAGADTGWWNNVWTAVFGTQEDVVKGQFKVRDPERRLYTQPAYVYSRAGQDENFVSEKDVGYFITEAMGEVDALMGKTYDYETSVTEWFDTSQPNSNTKITKVFLGKRPVRAITSVEEYDTNGDLVETYTNSDYYIDEKTGMLGLYTKEFEHQPRRVKIIYSYGFDTVPPQIQQITTIIAVIKLLLVHIGSSVDEVTSFSACGLCFTGNMKILTVNGYKTFKLLEDRDVEIINKDGVVSQSHVWSTGKKEVIKVKFDNGVEIECTPDHIFMLYNGEGCRADNLLGKEVLNYENIGIKVISLKLDKKEKIYDFTEPLTHWGIVNGMVVHNSMGVGEPYVASARSVELLKKELDRIISAFGRQRLSIFVV